MTGSGTASGDALHLQGTLSGWGPGIAVGTWQFNRGTGLDISAHYIGLQFGPIGLGSLDPRPPVPSPGDPAPPPGMPPPTDTGISRYGVVDTFSPGPSVGYTHLTVNPGAGSYFGVSVGWAPSASVTHNDMSRPTNTALDIGGNPLQNLLNYHPSVGDDTPAGHYVGVSVFGSF